MTLRYTDCARSGLCLKMFIYESLKSRLIKTTFSEIYPYKNGQKVLALGAIELNLT